MNKDISNTTKKFSELKAHDWMPTSKKEVDARGWDYLDVILFSGDAYVDHPSFGAAVIGRMLESKGYRVAIVPQPNWRDDLRDFKKLGIPRLFFGVTSGCMDSMVNHYTANKRIRSNDAYTPGGISGFRPDYGTYVYANILKQLYPNTPVILGGIEASLRRLTHYDYWGDILKPGILIDSKADMLVYGMGERPICDIAAGLRLGKTIQQLTNTRQIAYLSSVVPEKPEEGQVILNSFESCLADKRRFASNFCSIEEQSNRQDSQQLVEEAKGMYVVINPPYPLDTEESIDSAFDLPYTRLPHPRYKDKAIPAFEMIKFSVNIHRGCFGGCSFCTISAHQGKFVASRSERSILAEIQQVVKMPGFKGYLSDLGGPSANMYRMKGKDSKQCCRCRRFSCIYPRACNNLDTNHNDLLNIYRKARSMPGIKKVFVGSGIRYDLLMDNDGFTGRSQAEYFNELLQHHVSGRLKVAPEHTVTSVLKAMRKPDFNLFIKFKEQFDRLNRKNNLRQQLIPYFISSHPGCREEDMRQLSLLMRQMQFKLEQVQDFTPTPMTLSSVMFYCGFDPYTKQNMYVAKQKEEKLRQKDYFFK